MKKNSFTILALFVLFTACSSPKSYFTTSIRNKVESSGIELSKLQYYIDRDVELRRELVAGETKVSSGKIRIENGKSINIITLKKNTPGVCTTTYADKLLISFEMGDNKFLTFGKTKMANSTDPYRILANEWVGESGVIMYEGKRYFIQPSGTNASVMIKASVLRTSEVKTRQMKGRTVNS